VDLSQNNVLHDDLAAYATCRLAKLRDLDRRLVLHTVAIHEPELISVASHMGVPRV
jgi:hypothetical protein